MSADNMSGYQLKRTRLPVPLPWKVVPHIWNHATMALAHHKSEGFWSDVKSFEL